MGRTMRIAIICGALAALAVTTAAAAKSAKKTALDSYVNCLMETAQKLDDGKSDAKTIALGVAADCAWNRELAIAEMMTISDDPAAQKGAADGVRASELGRIVSMVLALRRRR